MTKEEKIKEAYIEVFGEKRIRYIMNYVYKENGFIVGFVLLDLKLDIKNEKLERKFNGVVYSYRPKSLQGIENNNGWIKIESEEDLPKICTYDMSKFKLMYWTNGGQYEANDYKKWILHYSHLKITHYQFIPIIKLNEPLY